MISYLRLSNFRRHVDTELHFEPNDQIVLVAGSNGVGKSTILEAVQYALYGEGRNGRGNVERLIRKGGELEGLEVEIHFDVAGVSYEVRRRRDSKITTALLCANEVPIVEGAREVSAEVAKILGMDARGFRLATYAQQRELDGLASMRPAERGQMLSRLLRLDVLTRAKEVARVEFRQRRDVLKALGSGGAVVETEQSIAQVVGEVAGLQTALDRARAEITLLDAEIAAGGALERAYQAAQTHRARLAALVQAAETETGRAVRELDAVVVPDLLASPVKTLEDLRNEGSEVERGIAAGEAMQRQVEQLQVVRGEVQRCGTRLDEIDAVISSVAGIDVGQLQNALADARTTVEALLAQRQGLREAYAGAKERLATAERALSKAEGLDAQCDACGQSVDEAHRNRHVQEAVERRNAAQAEIDRLSGEGAVVRAEVDGAERVCSGAEAAVRDALRETERADRLGRERTELLRRRDVYLEQVERLGGEPVELGDLYTRRAEIVVESNLAVQARERELIRNARLEQRAQLEKVLTAARSRLEDHKSALAESEISLDLELAHEQLQARSEARNNEMDIATGLQASIAASEERERGLRRELERTKAEMQKRASIDDEAQVALYASQVLERVETAWAQQLRPSLEGTVSELVMRLSDGRFDAVVFDNDYNVSVRDRGVVRPITELSGGEIDLVSLAVRLGLASVVTERHGSGGAGFLILDECFGSQDPARRGSILNALRGLKQTHGQIFLISHVGGLEDAADAVIEVELDEEANAVAVRS